MTQGLLERRGKKNTEHVLIIHIIESRDPGRP